MSKMVPLPTNSIIPERDLDKIPVLETRHLGIDFGGLTAVDEFNLTIGRTEIAGLIGPNHRLQSAHQGLPADAGHHPARRQGNLRNEHGAGQSGGHRAHLSEYPALLLSDR